MLPLGFEPAVAVRFNACGIIGADGVDGLRLLRKLNRQLALPPSGRIRLADLVVLAALEQVDEAEHFVSFPFAGFRLLLGGWRA